MSQKQNLWNYKLVEFWELFCNAQIVKQDGRKESATKKHQYLLLTVESIAQSTSTRSTVMFTIEKLESTDGLHKYHPNLS